MSGESEADAMWVPANKLGEMAAKSCADSMNRFMEPAGKCDASRAVNALTNEVQVLPESLL